MKFRIYIVSHEDLAQLDRIPDEVTNLYIGMHHLVPSFCIPRLSPSVRSLTLRSLSLTGAVYLHEGLEKLKFYGIETAVPFSQWSFPSTLKVVSVDLGYERTKVDLSSVPAPTIKLQLGQLTTVGPPLPAGLRNLILRSYDHISRIALPLVQEGVTDLEAYRTEAMAASDYKIRSETKIFLLPPHLECLELHGFEHFWDREEIQTQTLKELVVSGMVDVINYARVCPTLEKLSIGGNPKNRHLRGVRHPTLRELTLINVGANDLKIRTPEIRKLEILDPRGDAKFSLLEGSPEVMTLVGLREFPQVRDNFELRSLTVGRTKLMLPLIPTLGNLIVDKPQLTEGYEETSVSVSDIFEYKQAWGIPIRVKGAHTTR